MGCFKITYRPCNDAFSTFGKNLKVVKGKKSVLKKNRTNYFTGGSLLPGRNANPGSYRHGYQGSETDNEITGTSGTHITTFFRENDTRLLRWWSMDPVKYAWLSPYQSMNLNPILFNDPLGDKIRAGKQEKKDLRQQARSDKSFRKTYKKWKKADEIYEVNRQDQANGNATTTLNKAVPQSFNDEGKEGNKNYNYVYYSAVEGSKQGGYSVLELTYREVNEFSIMVSPMKWDDNSWSLSSQIQQNNFSHWQVFSPKMDNVDTKIKVQNANEQRTVLTSSVFNGNPSESIYNDGHDLQWGSIFYNFKVTAMSKPIIVRVDRNWLGRLKWSAGVYDYNPSFGESPESVSRDIGNPIRRKNYQGPWVVMSGKH